MISAASKDIIYKLKPKVVLTYLSVRCGSHRGGSPQDRLEDERTCETTLALAYVLHHLSAAWSQLQMMGRSPRWK